MVSSICNVAIAVRIDSQCCWRIELGDGSRSVLKASNAGSCPGRDETGSGINRPDTMIVAICDQHHSGRGYCQGSGVVELRAIGRSISKAADPVTSQCSKPFDVPLAIVRYGRLDGPDAVVAAVRDVEGIAGEGETGGEEKSPIGGIFCVVESGNA